MIFVIVSKQVNYPTLGTIYPYTKWMGVEQSEITSFAPFINEASGKVLLMGCGLGYLAYMLSLKDNVDEVTIVELDPSVKALFETYLKPQMNNKINIVLGDALEFLAKENISMYQYCSVDIWHNALDMFPIYLKCLLLEQKHPNTIFHYWIEEDLHVAMETIWIKLLKKLVDGEQIKDSNQIFSEILAFQNFASFEDIKNFIIAPKRPIIKKWAIENDTKARNHEDLTKTLMRLKK